jgi:hypothetical protein
MEPAEPGASQPHISHPDYGSEEATYVDGAPLAQPVPESDDDDDDDDALMVDDDDELIVDDDELME